MATKPENLYIGRVHKALPSSIYKEKMYNPLRRGTPDVWYSGPKGDLWVEYKYIEKLPPVVNEDKLLSPLQKKWILDRLDEGRNVWVIIGSPHGGIAYQPNRNDTRTYERNVFISSALSVSRIATFIQAQVA